MQDGHFVPEILCSICSGRLSLLPTDTCTDEKGKSVHTECYAKQVAAQAPVPPPTEGPFV